MGAEVGVRKISDDGEEETRGAIDEGYSRLTWCIFLTMVILDGFGLWKLFELTGFL